MHGLIHGQKSKDIKLVIKIKHGTEVQYNHKI